MPLSMYQASVPVFQRGLRSLSGILGKGAAFAEAKKIDPGVLIGDRLAPDMFALARQVQTASDTAKGCGARLAGIEVPRMEDTETSFPELQDRLARTIAFLDGIDAAAMDGSEDRPVTLRFPGGRELQFTGQSYLLTFALPNFFFHVTTAYAILRHNGVEIGKVDFLRG